MIALTPSRVFACGGGRAPLLNCRRAPCSGHDTHVVKVEAVTSNFQILVSHFFRNVTLAQPPQLLRPRTQRVSSRSSSREPNTPPTTRRRRRRSKTCRHGVNPNKQHTTPKQNDERAIGEWNVNSLYLSGCDNCFRHHWKRLQRTTSRRRTLDVRQR